MTRRALSAALLGVFIVLGPAAIARAVMCATGTRLLLVDTPSVPVGLYRAHATAERAVTVGAYACLLGSGPLAPLVLREAIASGLVAPRWEREPLVKIVAGVARDVVTYERGRVHVNGRPLERSTAREMTRDGQRLAHPTYPLRLREGEVWLTSVHEDGFDSRYYGPVATAALSCFADPVWTR